MTNTQLYLAIGVPVVLNAMLIGFFWLHMNTRFDSVNERFLSVGERFIGINQRFDAIDTRLDDLRDLWRAELLRVEGVLDARLKHLEEGSARR